MSLDARLPSGRSPAALFRQLNAVFGRIPYALPALLLRLVPAVVFWRSARTKVEGFAISDSTFWLFANEYTLPLIAPVFAAYLTTVAEHLLSALLALGLLTRLAALGMLAMTLVIQIFVYPDAWITHGLWAACFLTLMAKGPGAVSLDRLFYLDR